MIRAHTKPSLRKNSVAYLTTLCAPNGKKIPCLGLPFAAAWLR